VAPIIVPHRAITDYAKDGELRPVWLLKDARLLFGIQRSRTPKSDGGIVGDRPVLASWTGEWLAQQQAIPIKKSVKAKSIFRYGLIIFVEL